MTEAGSWTLLVYRLPAHPSSARVAIWRELRRLGALPLQQSCVVIPNVDELRERVDDIVRRIEGLDGVAHLFRLTDLSEGQSEELRSGWSALRAQEYAEIVEECRTKFIREVDFEIFRENLTAAEAEELEADLDKIRAWFARVQARDWFGAPNRAEAESAIAECDARLEDFTTRVFERESSDGPSLAPPIDMPWGGPDTEPDAEAPAGRQRA